MPDQTQLVQSIYSAIFNGLAASGASPAGNSFLSLEWPGMPVSDAEYGNPWTATNLAGSPAATQAFSALVDQIPSDSPVYAPTGLGVESVYGLILEASVAAGGPTAKTFADSQFQFASAVIGSSLDAQIAYHPSFPQPLGWSGAGSAGWTNISVNLTSPAPPKALPPEVYATVNRTLLTQGAQVGWRSAAIDKAAVERIKVPIRVFNGHPPAMQAFAAVPGPAATAVAPHAEVRFAGKPFNQAVATAAQASLNQTIQTRSITQTLSKPATAAAAPKLPTGLLDRLDRLPQGALRPGYIMAPTPIVLQPIHTKPISSSSLQLTMQVMRVNIIREWLNPLLFHLGGWSLDGILAGSISSGNSAANEGFFPLLPVSLLVVRNVSITGTWSADDKTYAQQASTPGDAVAFGPLTLSTAGSTQSKFDGATLTVPGMQVVAWYCMPVPKMPPA